MHDSILVRSNVMSTKSMPVSNLMTTNSIQVNSVITTNSLSLNNGLGTKTVTMPVKNGKTPTCKVCGDESSGYHYGVDSCEGCKGFFRRCITQGMTHKCSNEEKCEITPFTRNSCQYCRLKKCFAVGMSRDASRLGRRPKRLKDTTGEVKRETNLPIAPYPSPSELYKLRMAELQRLLQQNGTFKSDLMQAFLSAAQVSFREHQRNNNTTDNQKNNKTAGKKNSDKTVSSSNVVSPTDSLTSSTTTELIDDKSGITKETLDNYKPQVSDISQTDNNRDFTPMTSASEINPDIKIEPGLDNSIFSMSNMLPMDAASPFFGEMSPETMMMMPDMMGMMDDNSMMANMMSNLMSVKTPEADDNANEIDVERIMEEVKQVPSQLREQLIQQVIITVGEAHMATVRPTYARVAEANERFAQKIQDHGMPDLSKLSINPSAMWQKFTTSLVLEITNVVKFCKKLPGFGEIETDDQIILIKKGSFEVLLCRMCLLVDHEKQEMFDPNMEMKCPRQLVRQMPMGAFIEEFFSVAAQLNPIKLTDIQIGIFSACLIMCQERDGLKQVPAIEKLNSLFLQSLYVNMKTTHADYEDRFARLLSIIPVFKNLNSKHSMALNSMKMQKTEVLEDFPDLHKEVYDIKD